MNRLNNSALLFRSEGERNFTAIRNINFSGLSKPTVEENKETDKKTSKSKTKSIKNVFKVINNVVIYSSYYYSTLYSYIEGVIGGGIWKLFQSNKVLETQCALLCQYCAQGNKVQYVCAGCAFYHPRWLWLMRMNCDVYTYAHFTGKAKTEVCEAALLRERARFWSKFKRLFNYG